MGLQTCLSRSVPCEASYRYCSGRSVFSNSESVPYLIYTKRIWLTARANNWEGMHLIYTIYSICLVNNSAGFEIAHFTLKTPFIRRATRRTHYTHPCVSGQKPCDDHIRSNAPINLLLRNGAVSTHYNRQDVEWQSIFDTKKPLLRPSDEMNIKLGMDANNQVTREAFIRKNVTFHQVASSAKVRRKPTVQITPVGSRMGGSDLQREG